MKNSPASFSSFLRDGFFGSIRCGITKADVQQLLGKPVYAEDCKEGASVWCFWPLEIRFDQDGVTSIGLGFEWWDNVVPECLNVHGFLPVNGTSMETIVGILNSEGISFELGKDGRMLRTKAGVWIFPTHKQTIMSSVIQCGPSAFFDNYFRLDK